MLEPPNLALPSLHPLPYRRSPPRHTLRESNLLHLLHSLFHGFVLLHFPSTPQPRPCQSAPSNRRHQNNPAITAPNERSASHFFTTSFILWAPSASRPILISKARTSLAVYAFLVEREQGQISTHQQEIASATGSPISSKSSALDASNNHQPYSRPQASIIHRHLFGCRSPNISLTFRTLPSLPLRQAQHGTGLEA